MRRKIASTTNSQPAALEIARLPGNLCADGVGVGFLADQAYAEPMILGGGNIFQQHGCAAIHCDQHIYRAIIVEVSDGHAAGGERLVESRSGGGAHIVQSAAAVIVKEEQRLLVHYVTGMLF